MADDKNKPQEFYLPPPEMGRWEAFSIFLWNPEKKEVLGRTGSSWAKIGLFYLIFYAGLAAFFAIMLVIFFQTLTPNLPKWTLTESLIGSHPGLGFRPMPDDKHVDSTLIWFKHSTVGTWHPWVERLDAFLNEYKNTKDTQECSFNKNNKNENNNNNKPCGYNLNSSEFQDCHINKTYGYSDGYPCIVVKLNKIIDWVPIPFTSADIASNNEMPDSLKTLINNTSPNENYVWVTCDGENPLDKETIGPLSYYPKQGYPTYFYPYQNTAGYLSPIVLVKFHNPAKGVLINVECRAWAHNIDYNRMERKGAVHFELLVD